ncbi:MAG: ankyrin repeat domain-containing protein [Pseudomonadota bacterium]
MAFFSAVCFVMILSAGLTYAARPDQIYETAKSATVLIVAKYEHELSIPIVGINLPVLQNSVDDILRGANARRDASNIAEAVSIALVKKPLPHTQTLERLRVVEHKTGGTGSGFFVNSTGYVVTNAHVVVPDDDDMAKIIGKFVTGAEIKEAIASLVTRFPELKQAGEASKAKIVESLRYAFGRAAHKHGKAGGRRSFLVVLPGTSDGKEPKTYKAKLSGAGKPYPGKDVAILKVEGKAFPALALTDESKVKVGDQVYAVGFPGAASGPGMVDESSVAEPTITAGIVSAKKSAPDGWPLLQVDAAISPGNSGGPAFDGEGNVIGISTFKSIRTGAEGIGFLVPSSVVMEFLTRANVKWADKVIAAGKPAPTRAPEPSSEGGAALIIACRKGNVEIVKALLDGGMDVNVKGKGSVTPLSEASRNGHTEVVKLLLSKGADPRARSEEGSTPLMLATQEGHGKVVELLLKHGAKE